MTALDFYIDGLKAKGFSDDKIKELTEHKDLPWLQFAEDYHTKQLILSGVVKSLPTQKEIDLKAEERAIKHNYINEIGFIRHKTSFQLGALFVKEHLEKQK